MLDLGCGYGSFTGAMTQEAGIECVGVDVSEADLEVARRLYPGGEFLHADAESLPFDDSSFHTVVLRDALHHLVHESDWDRVGAEMARVSAPRARLIVFDPNVQPLLRLARAAARHQDEECTYENALAVVANLGFRPVHADFHTFLSLPLSGGFVGRELIGDWPGLQRALLRADEAIEQSIGRRRIARQTAWRYLIVGEGN